MLQFYTMNISFTYIYIYIYIFQKEKVHKDTLSEMEREE